MAGTPEVYVKSRRDAPPGFFEVEAAGLRWLDVPGGAPVVQPLEVGPTRLVLPRLTEVEPDPASATAFGRTLAVTHGAGARWYGVPADGWTGDGYIGDVTLPHPAGPPGPWGAFYAAYRVLPFVRDARDRGLFSAADVLVFERVGDRLGTGEFDDPADAPARIHGDLWAGNVLWCADGVHLIDPAAHGGHRETDLAMLAVFGLPHLERVRAAYDEVHPLAAGWRTRVALHQLHPLLVHVVLFGGSYAGQALAAARRYA